MEQLILSIDIGGTYIKAALFDLKGRQRALYKRLNHVISEKPDYSEYAPEQLWDTVCTCMRSVIECSGTAPESIAAIGISAQGSGAYFMGEHGEPIRNFISSGDRRSRCIVERWNENGLEKKLFPYIYRKASCGHTDAILTWLHENEANSFEKLRWHFSMKDYFVYRLTGKIISGRGCMSCTGLLNMETGEYDEKLLEMYGLPELAGRFGPLKWDIECCGGVTEEAARCCGCRPGTPVAAGSHDVVATAVAMGCIDDSYCFVVMGTCSINGYISEIPILDGSIKFNERFAIPGLFLIEQPGAASSGTLEWVIDVMFRDGSLPRSDLYELINQEVSSVEPDIHDPVFVPFMRGSDEYADERGSWIGLTTQHTRAHMLRAVYEGAIFAHMKELDVLFAKKCRPERIRIGGGAAKSEVWMHMFADIAGVPIEVAPKEEMTAKGAAIIASVASDIYPDLNTSIAEMTQPGVLILPRPEYRKLYQKKYDRFKKLRDMLGNVWPYFENNEQQ